MEEQMDIEKEEYFNENSDIETQEEYLEEFENIKKNKNMISNNSNFYVNDIEDYLASFNIYGFMQIT